MRRRKPDCQVRQHIPPPPNTWGIQWIWLATNQALALSVSILFFYRFLTLDVNTIGEAWGAKSIIKNYVLFIVTFNFSLSCFHMWSPRQKKNPVRAGGEYVGRGEGRSHMVPEPSAPSKEGKKKVPHRWNAPRSRACAEVTALLTRH